tara:strand:+ start:269 stop:436 length:168 start_codon:yes stop_codon:yes gene_type:complete
MRIVFFILEDMEKDDEEDEEDDERAKNRTYKPVVVRVCDDVVECLSHVYIIPYEG